MLCLQKNCPENERLRAITGALQREMLTFEQYVLLKAILKVLLKGITLPR